MRIHYFEYENKVTGLKIEQIDFSDLTLLVGVSGVGKTQILRAILDLKKIARGNSLNGVIWEICFSTNDGKEYLWEGTFEYIEELEYIDIDGTIDDEITKRSKIESEKLLLNDKLIIERQTNKIKLNDQSIPKLSSYASILSLLNEEDDIIPASDGFNKIIYTDYSDRSSGTISIVENFKRIKKEYRTLDRLQNSDLPVDLKLNISYQNKINIFDAIRDGFIEVFPQVEDITFEPIKDKDLPSFFRQYPILQIKERNVQEKIPQPRISSGMYRVLMHLSEIYLSAEGTVILIDEFENSLGINCIDVVTDALIHQDRNLQFILTSHHPYVINKIDMKHWKVVTRTGGVISTKSVEELNLGKSRHEAFMQLINHPDFEGGIKVG